MLNRIALAVSRDFAAGTLAIALLMIAPSVNSARADQQSRSNFTPVAAQAVVQLVVATPSLSSQFKRLRSHKKLAACWPTGTRCSRDDQCCDPYICEFNICW